MCHHFDSRRWDERTAAETETEDEETDEVETPEFLAEEPAEEVDLLTDGGDEE